MPSPSGSSAKKAASEIGTPSRMRFSAPTDGFMPFDSISDTVEFVTPARLASARCESPCRRLTCRSLPPTSTFMARQPVQVMRIR